jgi:hypothetical protein
VKKVTLYARLSHDHHTPGAASDAISQPLDPGLARYLADQVAALQCSPLELAQLVRAPRGAGAAAGRR